MSNIQTTIDHHLSLLDKLETATFNLRVEINRLRQQLQISLSSAAQRTFSVAELLEMLLVELAPRDVLLAQRVNKQWQGGTTASLKLQQLLSSKAVSAQILVFNDEDEDGDDIDGVWEDIITKEEIPAVQNPMLSNLFCILSTPMQTRYRERLPRPWLQPEASWRRMLVAQPSILGKATTYWDETLNSGNQDSVVLEDGYVRTFWNAAHLSWLLGPEGRHDMVVEVEIWGLNNDMSQLKDNAQIWDLCQ
jgi:hypothetical protein